MKKLYLFSLLLFIFLQAQARPPIDTTPPVIVGTLPLFTIEGCSIADKPLAMSAVLMLESNGLTISDDTTPDANLTVTVQDIIAPATCPILITRIYTITDAALNSSTVEQSIYIDDTILPTITGTVATQLATPMPGCLFMVKNVKELVRAISTDNCTASANLDITQNPTAGTIMTSNTTVDVTVTDLCGNSSVTTVDVVLPAKPTINLAKGPTCAANLLTYSLEVIVSSGVVTATYGTVTQTAALTIFEVTGIDPSNNTLLTVTDANGCTNTLLVVSPDGCTCPPMVSPISGGNIIYPETDVVIPALTASLTSGDVLEWFDVMVGGAPLGTGPSFTPPAQAVGTTVNYYVRSREIATNCVSPRVEVTITKTPAASIAPPVEDISSFITTYNNSILFKECVGDVIQILEVSGSVLYSCKIFLEEQAIPVPAKGLYLVKIKGKTLKVLVR